MDERIANRKLHFETNAKLATSESPVGEDGHVAPHPQLMDALGKIAEALGSSHQKIMEAVTAPRRTDVHRHPNGRVSHATSKVTVQ